MWVIAIFDLPTDTRVARKAYARFRKNLLDDGFTMMQYSVYSRHCASIENADGHVGRMGHKLPSAVLRLATASHFATLCRPFRASTSWLRLATASHFATLTPS
jgi:CRISPR/Cas system-associated protein endoribonuclease Cas2